MKSNSASTARPLSRAVCRCVTTLASTLLVTVLASGCTSKSKAREEAKKAYIAGQQQAWQQWQIANPNSVRFDGPVANPIIGWTEGLTLVQAIVEAHYQSRGEPNVIIVQRGQQRFQFNAKQLLKGEDLVILPGDQVILRP